jgi:uncharacterized protein YacL
MIRRIVRGIITLLFGAAGLYLDSTLFRVLEIDNLGATLGLSINIFWTYIISFILFAIIGFLLAPVCMKFFLALVKWLESRITRMPTHELIGGSLGVILGLLIASLFRGSFANVPFIGPVLSVIISFFFGYIGLIIGIKRKDDFLGIFDFIPKLKGDKEKDKAKEGKTKHKNVIFGYKVLDTSVIIDGRIADIVKTGFLDGILLIPGFVLEELRHIADSSDMLKRNRGRRGLDILNQISKDSYIKVASVAVREDITGQPIPGEPSLMINSSSAYSWAFLRKIVINLPEPSLTISMREWLNIPSETLVTKT